MESDMDFLSCLEKGILTNQGSEISQKYDQQSMLQLTISAISLDSKNTSLMRLFNLNYRSKTLDSASITDNSTEIVYIMRLLSGNNSDNLQLWDNVVAVNANKSNFELESNGVIKLKFNETIPIFQKEKSDDFFLVEQDNFMLEMAFALMTHFNNKPKIIGIVSTQIKAIELYGKRLTLPIYTSDLKQQGFVFATVALKGVKWREMSDKEIVDYAQKESTPITDYNSTLLSNPILQHFDYLNKCIENMGTDSRTNHKGKMDSAKLESQRSDILYDFENESVKFSSNIFNDSIINTDLDKSARTPNLLVHSDSSQMSNRFREFNSSESDVTTPMGIISVESNRFDMDRLGKNNTELQSNLMQDLLCNYDKLKSNSDAKVYLDNIAIKNYSSLMDELVETSRNPIGIGFKKSYITPSLVEINGINSVLDLKQMQRKILSKRVENLLLSNEYKTNTDNNYRKCFSDNWVENVNQLLKNAGERLNIYFNDPQLVSPPVM